MGADANLYALLNAGFRSRLDQPFLHPPGEPPLSYREAVGRAAQLAGALRRAGVAPGGRVVSAASKSPDAVCLYLACLQVGAIYVPLNPGFTAAETDYYILDAEPTVLVTDPGHAERTETTTFTLDGVGGGSLVKAALEGDPFEGWTPRAGDDPAAMLYTSGTTGRPKGAVLTHANLTANGLALRSSWGFSPDDVLLHSLPIFHTHGLFVALHCTLLSGSSVIFLRRFDLDAVFSALPVSTVFMGVPTYYARMLSDRRLNHGACERIRLFTSGSAPLTETAHRDFAEKTGHLILERYGMTEAGIITSNPLVGQRVAGSVGFPLPGVELRVDVPKEARDNVGVVKVRGPSLFPEYWRKPDQTRESRDEHGWFDTGDLGSVDPSGRLTLEGRISDMIISGGENVYPKEVELCLESAPGVDQAAVVGAPDHDLGEQVVAFIVATDQIDLHEVRAHVGSCLARFKHPRRYEVVDDLPRNAMGKVQKSDLRAGLEQ